MGAPILHVGAVVLCAHGGQALPTTPSPVVLVNGMPITTIAAPYSVAGCAFVPPPGNGPCVTAQWVVGALQVLSQGQPVAIMTGMAACIPTGTPLMPVMAQTMVLAT
jgi:hypothetical protein